MSASSLAFFASKEAKGSAEGQLRSVGLAAGLRALTLDGSKACRLGPVALACHAISTPSKESSPSKPKRALLDSPYTRRGEEVSHDPKRA